MVQQDSDEEEEDWNGDCLKSKDGMWIEDN